MDHWYTDFQAESYRRSEDLAAAQRHRLVQSARAPQAARKYSLRLEMALGRLLMTLGRRLYTHAEALTTGLGEMDMKTVHPC